MAMIPLAVALLPLLPPLVQGILDIIDRVKDDPATPADAKAQLDAISDQLDVLAVQVAAFRP